MLKTPRSRKVDCQSHRREDVLDYLDHYDLDFDRLRRLTFDSDPTEYPTYWSQYTGLELVYFVQAVNGGPIKIGTTNDLWARLKTIQAHSPVQVQSISAFPGNQETERRLHEVFDEHRLHYEWFEPTPTLWAFAGSFETLYPALSGLTA